jgi:hypothetical protein
MHTYLQVYIRAYQMESEIPLDKQDILIKTKDYEKFVLLTLEPKIVALEKLKV